MLDQVNESAGEMTVGDYITILSRRRWIILQVFVLVCACGVFFTYLTKPTYRATTAIVVSDDKSNPFSTLGKDFPFADLVPPSGFSVDTQIEMLKSSELLEDSVVGAVDPTRPVPDLTQGYLVRAFESHGFLAQSAGKDGATIQRIFALARSKAREEREQQIERRAMETARLDPRYASLSTAEQQREVDAERVRLDDPTERRKALDKAESRLFDLERVFKVDVREVQDTNVVDIAVDSHEANWARALVTSLPVALNDSEKASRANGIRSAIASLTAKLQDEREQFRTAQTRLNEFRKSKQVVNVTDEITLRLQNAIANEENLRIVQSDLAGELGELSKLQHMRDVLPKFVETKTSQTNVEERQALQTRLTELRSDRAGLLKRYEPTHQKVQDVDGQIAFLESRLRDMEKNITSNTTTSNPAIDDYDTKIAEIKGLVAQDESALAEMKGRSKDRMNTLGNERNLAIQEDELERAVDQHSTMEIELGKTLQDLNVRKDAIEDPAFVISKPEMVERVSPIWWKNLLATLIVALLLALCAAALQEYLDDRIHTPDEAVRYIDAPCLGYVPLIEKQNGLLLRSNGRGGPLLETYRLLRSNVEFAAVDSPIRSILVTSSMPGEGKTMTVSNLAIAAAMNGRKVIIVDADLRRPAIHNVFDCKRHPGLTNVLIGRTKLADALQDTDIPGLRVLTSGHLPPNPAEILSSRAMRDLLIDLQNCADLVIVDSPPVLATADPQVLSAHVGGVVYVVHLGETPKSAIRAAGDLLRQSRARTLGIVFNKVKVGHGPSYRYGYGYGYRYYSYYSQHDGQSDDQGQALDEPQTRSQFAAEFEALPRKAYMDGASDPTADSSSQERNNSDV